MIKVDFSHKVFEGYNDLAKQSYIDSDEEVYFYWWCLELASMGLITFTPKVQGFLLSKPLNYTRIKVMKRVEDKKYDVSFIREHVYTPDFLIKWDFDVSKHKLFSNYVFFDGKECKSSFNAPFVIQEPNENYDFYRSWFEVKSPFDFQNMTRLATINQKWVYDKFGEIINIVKVGATKGSLFDKTFTPDKFNSCNKSNKARTIKFNIKNLMDYLDC